MHCCKLSTLRSVYPSLKKLNSRRQFSTNDLVRMAWINNYRLRSRPYEVNHRIFDWVPSVRHRLFDDDLFSFIREVDHWDRMTPRLEQHRGFRKQLAIQADKTQTQEGPTSVVSGEGDEYLVQLQAQGFKPDEIQVRVRDGCVVVEAEKEESDEKNGTYRYRQIHERFSLPTSVDSNLVTCQMTKDGALQIRAPVPKTVQQEDTAKRITIQQTPDEQTSEEKN